MSQQDVATMRSAYEAFNRGEIPAVLNAFDPAIEWNEPGGGHAPRGTFRGHQSVANDVFSTVPQNFEQFEARTDQFIDAADRLVVTGQFRGRTRSGQPVEVPFAHVWTMRGGKAAGFQNYVDAPSWTRAWGG
jgi:ketosteroid isomerase-like protein